MYSQKAFEILNSSINSAVFIDEKARGFYSEGDINPDSEEQLSVDLFNTFKRNGKNLAVHKFEKSDIDDEKIINYLFNNRDLILLDWELDEVTGQKESLALLAKAIQRPQISFCCIYSRSNNFNQIPFFLTAYFSGLTEMDFRLIADTYSFLDRSELKDFRDQSSGDLVEFFQRNGINLEEFPIERIKGRSLNLIFDLIDISLESDKFYFPESDLNSHEIIYSGNDSFIVNNTFILAIRKELADSDYESLIRRISAEIIKNENSFFQLLGLEMQAIFNNNEKFIDETILTSSTEALFRFRNHLNDDISFGIIVKKLLLEQAVLKLRTAELRLLDPEFLVTHGATLSGQANAMDLFQLNVFYNSVVVRGLNNLDVPNLNFGDVFIDHNRNYYLCVTALCDCHVPSKIDFNFYFVKGREFEDIETALLLGDRAFLSFFSNGRAVYWGNIDKPSLKRTGFQLSNSSDEVSKLLTDIETLKKVIEKFRANQEQLMSFLYRPFYIKPKVYNVENNKLINNKIKVCDLTNLVSNGQPNQDLNFLELEYVSTLRADYAQRIANHAFGHSVRVGVDFVKS